MDDIYYYLLLQAGYTVKWGQVPQALVQLTFKYTQGGRVHRLSWQSVPVLNYPHYEKKKKKKKKISLIACWHFSCCNLCPLPFPEHFQPLGRQLKKTPRFPSSAVSSAGWTPWPPIVHYIPHILKNLLRSVLEFLRSSESFMEWGHQKWIQMLPCESKAEGSNCFPWFADHTPAHWAQHSLTAKCTRLMFSLMFSTTIISCKDASCSVTLSSAVLHRAASCQTQGVTCCQLGFSVQSLVKWRRTMSTALPSSTGPVVREDN